MWKNWRERPPAALVLAVWHTGARVGVARSAGALAYFLVLTLFPLLLCLQPVVGRFHLDLARLVEGLDHLLPAGVGVLLEDYLTYVASVQSTPLVWAGVFTILLSASAGLRTLFHTLDDLYGRPRRRGVRAVLESVALSALLLGAVYLAAGAIFLGEWAAELLPEGTVELWRWLRYLVLYLVLLALVLGVYRAGLPREDRRPALWAALGTAAALAVGSGGFSWFVSRSARYALVYGSLASLILLLVWLYFCGYVLLLGAVVCREIGDILESGEWSVESGDTR